MEAAMWRFTKVCFFVCFFVASSVLIFGQANPSKSGERVDLPSGVSGDWWATVQQNIEREEYNITPAAADSKALLGASNRAQGFRTEFSEKGISVEPLSAERRSWSWGIELQAKAESLRLKADVRTSDNRVEIDRGNITEWYVNSPDGIEQGFTISKPIGNAGKLNIDMKLTGDLHPKFAEDCRAIDFYGNSNVAVISYSKLKVTDAMGNILPSKFEAINGGLRISVDDRGATYPVIVDPLATSPSWVMESNQASANLAYSVSTAGDVNGDGYSDVIVGAPYFNNGETGEGRVYLYLGSVSGLVAYPSCILECNIAGSNLGTSVAAAGDVNGDGYSDVVAGAPGGGCVYLYLGSSSGLQTSPSWTASNEQVNCKFGYSVASAGDVNGDGYDDIIIGAFLYNYNKTDEGRAYLYLGSPYGLAASYSWAVEGDQNGAYFGRSVSSAGDVNGDGYGDVLVGAYGYDNGEANEGMVFLFLGSSSGLTWSSSWTIEGGLANAYLGWSVSTAGDVNGDGYSDVVVGACAYGSGFGRGCLYLGSTSGLSPSPSWVVDGAQASANFGFSIATAGDVNGDGYSDVIAGAPYHDNGETDEGKAYLYLGGPSGLSATTGWNSSGEAADNYFGYSVTGAGDVNGDGFSDVVVGAFGYDGNRGKAYLFPGSASGLATTASWSKTGETAGDYFGTSVGSAGDVNGDGYTDVIIGASNHSSYSGRAYLYLGGASGLSSSASWTATGESVNSYFGATAAMAGDVNGDGYSDVVIGAYGYGVNTGKVYCYKGGAAGLSSLSSWTATGQTSGERFGVSISSAGDVDGDGYSDVIVGADGYDGFKGRVYLYRGGASGLLTASSWTATGETAGNCYGHSLASCDVNGDGYSDVIVAASYYGSYRGKIYVYDGSWAGLPAAASFSLAGEYDYDEFGISIASGGDVNGDGFSDVVVGADGSGAYSGKAYFYLGSAIGITSSASWTAAGENSSDRLGLPVASAGDVNGDGYSDLITGACWYNGKAGKAYLYYGNGGPGAVFKPQQIRDDLTVPICSGGNAYEQKFRLGLTLKSPSGKVWSKLQWQLAPWGGVFAPSVNPIQSDGSWYHNPVRRTAPITLPEDLVRYVWRARVKYHPARSPFVHWSRWFTIPDNGLCETDLISTSASEPYPPSGCVLPDEPCFIYLVTQNGSNYTLNWQDPNQADQRTGWNVRRSNNAALTPKSSWPLMGTNIVDCDAGAPNYQWTDSSGDDPSPSAVWYYLVTTYNDNCPAEGPFSSE